MKTIITFLTILLFCIFSFAQNGINYKAIIKDNNGNVIANQSVTIEFSILQGIEQTTAYRETHVSNTNDNGLIILNIGEGTVGFGIFNDINWRADDHFLRVRISTGSGFINLGTTQFMAVPYALHAKNVSGLEAIDEGNGIGWRLIGSNPDYYGDIGLNAVDLSYNLAASTVRGATGANSTAMGSLTEASAIYSTALGRNTIASEFGATAMGFSTIASGINSFAVGHLTEAPGDYSTAMGSQTTASGDYSTAMGSQVTASGPYSTAMGRNTTASGNYSTAMGRNTTAVSYATAMGDGTEASASYATAMGRETRASGNIATAMGFQTIASAQYSTALGNGTEASASSSTAMGGGTTASGNFSTAMGFNTTASGTYSTANGHFTAASGFMATAMGNRTIAPSYAETVIGIYNTNYTPNASLTWDATDRLFVIGNGTSSTRSNAMVVLKNGNTGFGTDNPQELLHISGGRLRIGNETVEDGGSDILAFSSSLVPTIDEEDRLGGPNRRWLDVYAANGTIQTSDRRSKTNIANLSYGLNEVLQMQPVSFNWKNKNNPDTKLGLIAQDLQVLVPEVVHSHIWEKDEDSGALTKKEIERLGVYYSDLVPVLINAIKEQQKIIKTQNTKIEAIEINLNALMEANKKTITNTK